MKMLFILTLLCIDNFSAPAVIEKVKTIKKETREASFQLAPSVIIVY
jgi:hypothetical protein